jgi:hypothetical protein
MPANSEDLNMQGISMQSVPQLLTSEQKLGVSTYQEQLDEAMNDQNYLWKVTRDETWLTVTTQKPNGSPSVEKLTFPCVVSCQTSRASW